MAKPRTTVDVEVNVYVVKVRYSDDRTRRITERETVAEAVRVAMEMAMQTGYVFGGFDAE